MSRRTLRACLLSCLALAGCGGGIFLGFGDDFDDPPSVNLAVTPGVAGVGEIVRLVAAASDDFAVHEVAFFRLDTDGRSQLLGSDRSFPYELDAAIPDTLTPTVQFFARAIDDIGQASDSALVAVTVLR
jgi:hypothetical protein